MIKASIVKRKLKCGEPLLMSFMCSNDPVAAEIMAMCGIDIVVVDNEHFALNDEQIMNICRAVTAYDSACLLRTAVLNTEMISRYMDFGLSGIVATQTHNVEHAKKIIDAVKYPPIGKRGIGTSRAAIYGYSGMSNEEYMAFTNENTIIFVVLEDMEAIKDAEKIAKLEHIDSVHIGPIDLSASMGFGGNPAAPEVRAVVADTVKKITAAGSTAADFATQPDQIAELVDHDSRIICIGTDHSILAGTFSAYRKALNDKMGKRKL